MFEMLTCKITIQNRHFKIYSITFKFNSIKIFNYFNFHEHEF